MCLLENMNFFEKIVLGNENSWKRNIYTFFYNKKKYNFVH